MQVTTEFHYQNTEVLLAPDPRLWRALFSLPTVYRLRYASQSVKR